MRGTVPLGLKAAPPSPERLQQWQHRQGAGYTLTPRLSALASLPPPGLDNVALTVHLFPTWAHHFLADQTFTVTHCLCVRYHPPGRQRTLGWVDSIVAVAVPTRGTLGWHKTTKAGPERATLGLRLRRLQGRHAVCFDRSHAHGEFRALRGFIERSFRVSKGAELFSITGRSPAGGPVIAASW